MRKSVLKKMYFPRFDQITGVKQHQIANPCIQLPVVMQDNYADILSNE